VEKAPDAFRTISEVAADLNVPQHVLRFWESRFNEIKPMKRGGGRRYYRPEDVDLLRGIRHLLYGEGYTIRGVQRILKDQGLRYVQTVWQPGAAGGVAADSEDVDFAGDESDASGQSGRERGRGLFGLLPSLIGNTNEPLDVKGSAKQEDQEEDEDYEEEESDEDADAEDETDEEDVDEEDEDDSEVGEDDDGDYDDSGEEDSDEEEGDEDDDDDDDDADQDDDDEEDKKPAISRQAPSKQAPRPLMLRRAAQPIGGSLRAAISIDDMRKLESALDELSECRKLLEALD
jgi:DNA-binding transcriptional MerR regulator